jgi:DNA polymerase family A
LNFQIKGKILIGETITFLSELDVLMTKHECDNVVITDKSILKVLFPDKKIKEDGIPGAGLSIADFKGNLIYSSKNKPILILFPLKHLFSMPEGKFLLNHYLDKLYKPERFISFGEFKLEIPNTKDEFYDCLRFLEDCNTIAIDIETGINQKIKCISFCGIHNKTNAIKTFGFLLDDMVKYETIKTICNNKSSKVFQNGRFDVLHLLHWDIPVRNWYWDTYGMFSCIYAELPRSLDYISSFCIKDILYWKDESKDDLLLYNAKDTYCTLKVFLWMIHSMPQYAKDNYYKIFKIVFPAISCEFEGILVDKSVRIQMENNQRKIIQKEYEDLNYILGTQFFNPASPPQVKSLLKFLAPNQKVESSDVTAVTAIADRHPLNAVILSKMTNYRKSLKMFSTYIDAHLWNDRVTYSIDPFGTDTGRSACRASSFYEKKNDSEDNDIYIHYGVQVQNIPAYFKECLRADPDFLLVEMDKSQAESRCTAYLSRDSNLINTVETSPDFHCTNASMFFGIPFELLYDIQKYKVLDKDIRQLAKRVNHGANYNMGAWKLVNTMGEKNIYKAKVLLKLPSKFTALDTAEYLLSCFDKAYPRVRHDWQAEIINEVEVTHKLITPDGWTRRTFLNPRENKNDLNALVAHSPQHLNIALVNEGFFKIWYELENPETFRVKAQIHDSVLFQVHKDHLYLIEKAQVMYDSTSRITVHGKEMFIPSDVSEPNIYWKENKIWNM